MSLKLGPDCKGFLKIHLEFRVYPVSHRELLDIKLKSQTIYYLLTLLRKIILAVWGLSLAGEIRETDAVVGK